LLKDQFDKLTHKINTETNLSYVIYFYFTDNAVANYTYNRL